jgi:hypothetical protein
MSGLYRGYALALLSGVQPWEMGDNSISPRERIPGGLYPHSTLQMGGFIFSTHAPVPTFRFILPVLATWDIRSKMKRGKRNVENFARYVDKEEKTERELLIRAYL